MTKQPELTRTRIDATQPVPGKVFDLWDGACPGLVLRVMATARTWVYVYRLAGRRYKLKLGAYPALTIADARAAARAQAAKVASGGNPAEERRQKREELDLWGLFQRYKVERLTAGSLRTGAAVARSIEIHVLRLGDDGKPHDPIARRKLSDMTTGDVAKVQRRIGDDFPTQANRVGAHCSAMFAWAMKQRPALATANPWEGFERKPEERRERYASEEELTKLRDAIGALPDRKVAAAIELLMLTGARSGETRRSRWEDFDLTAGTWSKPAATTKQAKRHIIPLSPHAVAVLARLRETADADCPWVFPDAKGASPIPAHVLDNRWRAVRKAAGLRDFRKHDLRHTFASILVSGKQPLPIVGALLGHSTPATTARYSHLADNPLRAAVRKAGSRIAGAAPKAGKGGDVVAMRRART